MLNYSVYYITSYSNLINKNCEDLKNYTMVVIKYIFILENVLLILIIYETLINLN